LHNNYREKPKSKSKYKKIRLTIITCHRKRSKGTRQLSRGEQKASVFPTIARRQQLQMGTNNYSFTFSNPLHYTSFPQIQFFSHPHPHLNDGHSKQIPRSHAIATLTNPRTQRNRWPKSPTARAAPRRRNRRKSCDYPRNRNRSRSRRHGHRHYHSHPRAPRKQQIKTTGGETKAGKGKARIFGLLTDGGKLISSGAAARRTQELRRWRSRRICAGVSGFFLPTETRERERGCREH